MSKQADEELRKVIKSSLVKFRKYLCGPVPSDMVYAPPDFDEYEHITNEILKALESRDQQIALAAEDAFVEKLIAKVQDGSIEMIGINIEQLTALKQAQNKEK